MSPVVEDTTDGGLRRGIDEAAGDVASEVVPAIPDSLAAARDRLLADTDRPTGEEERAARDGDADADSGVGTGRGPSPERVLEAALAPTADPAEDGDTTGQADDPRPPEADHAPEGDGGGEREVAEE